MNRWQKRVWKEPSRKQLAQCKGCNHPLRAEIERGFALDTHKVHTFKEQYGYDYQNAQKHYYCHLSPAQRAVLFDESKTQAAVTMIEESKINVLESLKNLGVEADKFLKTAKEKQ